MMLSIEMAGAAHGFLEYDRGYRADVGPGSDAQALSDVRSTPAPNPFNRSRLCVRKVIDAAPGPCPGGTLAGFEGRTNYCGKWCEPNEADVVRDPAATPGSGPPPWISDQVSSSDSGQTTPNAGAARSRLTTMTPSTYRARVVERRTDSMDDMIRTSVVQLPIALLSQRGDSSPRCQTLHPVR
jgi:hypothetical protein